MSTPLPATAPRSGISRDARLAVPRAWRAIGVGGVLILVAVVVAVFAPALAPHEATAFDLLHRVYGYPLEYVIEALAPTTERDFALLPEDKQAIYDTIQRTHIHGSPDGPWFFLIAQSLVREGTRRLIGIKARGCSTFAPKYASSAASANDSCGTSRGSLMIRGSAVSMPSTSVQI